MKTNATAKEGGVGAAHSPIPRRSEEVKHKPVLKMKRKGSRNKQARRRREERTTVLRHLLQRGSTRHDCGIHPWNPLLCLVLVVASGT